MPHRYVVIVPPNAPETLAYLTESLKNVPDVQVIVDRRRPTAPPVRPAIERRGSEGPRRTLEAFGCTLVRISAPPPAAERETPPSNPSSAATVIPFGPVRLRALPTLREG